MPLSDAWIDFVGGWCSGAAAVLCLQPVDTILTRWQAGLLAPTAGTAELGRSTRVWIQAQQGGAWRALWRGSSPMIGAVPLQNALLMGGYGIGQEYSTKYNPEYRRTAIFVGGCTGGILQSFLMSPVELVKVSQQCAGQSLSAATKQVALNLYHAAAWRGLTATLLRDGIPHGVWFVTYDVCKSELDVVWNQDPVAVPLVSGAMAAAVAWGVGYPADVIKTRQQAAVSTTPLGVWATGRVLVAEANGNVLRGLYRGFGLKLVRSVPASMIGFTVYEFVKRNVLDVL